MYQQLFSNRTEAGRFLASKLGEYANRSEAVVLGLPRGGVPIAFEVAKALGVPLDVFIVRKLGVPGQEELAFGAIASNGVRVLNENLVRALRLPETVIESVAEREQRELERREQIYRGGRSAQNLKDKIVIVVDDGLATGATMRAAIKAIKKQIPKKTIVAVPVGSQQTCDEFKHEADVLCICATTPEPFYGVGMWYEDFEQTTDEEVIKLLSESQSFNGKIGRTA